jgi:hypothetical protein
MPTTRRGFHDELVRISEIARQAGHLVPHATARAAKVTTPTMRQYLRGTADPGNPWERDQILMDIVNALQIRPV